MAFIVYRASAGSGKTYTLVRNYLLLALGHNDPAYFRHILAITFTNKAANEMKNRVLKALFEIAGNPQSGTLANDLAQNLHLTPEALQYRAETVVKTILHRYQDFSISTIDAFVARIGRSFARDLQLHQGFEITLNQQELSQQAVEWLLAQIGQDEALTETLINFSKTLAGEDKNWDIRKSLLDYTKELFRDETLDKLEALSTLKHEHLQQSRQQYLQYRQAFSNSIREIAGEMMQIIHNAGLTVADFSYNSSGFAGFIEKCLTLEQNWLLKPGARFTNVLLGSSPIPAKANKNTQSAYEGISDQLLAWGHKLNQLFEEQLPQLNLLQAIDSSLYATATMRQLREAIENVLEEQQATTLGELYHRIGLLLNDSATPYIYERMGSRYRHFLIDEFQDTSLVQWRNLAPLVDNGLAEQQFSLLVGDPKQAIYRWRSGEAGQFVQLPAPYGNQAAYASFYAQYEGRNLSDNYRSGEVIIDFNNRLFTIWSERLRTDLQPYYTDLSQHPKKAGGFVQINLLPKPAKKSKSEQENDETSEETSTLALAMQRIIAEIHALHARGFAYGDMAVLVRQNKTGALVAQHLLEAGLDVMSSDSLLMGNHLDLQLIVQCIRWLYTNDPLAEAALHQQLSHRFTSYPGTPGLFFKQNNRQWNAKKLLSLPLYSLGEHLLEIFALNKQSDPFVLALLDQMHHFSKKPATTIDAWLDWWDNKGQETAIDLPEALDAVRIMTFHKAKGLEFPVVFLPETQKSNPGNRPDWHWIKVESSPLPMAMVNLSALKEAPPAYQALYEEEKAKKELDYLNMLYVACTRATTALYLYGQSNDQPPAADSIQFSDVIRDLAGIVFDENQQAYWGQLPEQYVREEQQQQPAIQIKHTYYDWQSTLRLSTPFNPSAEEDSPVQKGRMIHQLLAGIRQLDDVPEQIRLSIAHGFLDEKAAEQLRAFTNKLRADTSLAPFFDPEAEVLNEHAIVGPGIHARPDRLVIKDQKAWVLEYKTGQPQPQHQQQLDQYLDLMEAMGYEASGRLLYFEMED